MGHLRTNLDDVLTFFILAGLHFLVLPETQLVDHSIAGEVRARGFKLYNLLRPRSEAHPDRHVGGGLALLVRATTTIHENTAPCKTGAISVRVTPKGMSPVNVIGVYLAPYGTKLLRDEETGAWNDGRVATLRYIVREHTRLRRRGLPTIILGDFNARLASTSNFPRSTNGTIPPDSHYMRETSAQLQALCAGLGVSPIHGRAGQPSGENTSPVPGHPGLFYEIDYILTDASLVVEGGQYGWLDGRNPHLHRAVTFTVKVASPSTQTATPPAPTIPKCFLYGDGAGWQEIAQALSKRMPRMEAYLHSEASLDSKVAFVEHSIKASALEGHRKHPRHPFRTHIFRRFRELAVPPTIAAKFARARTLRGNAHDLNKRGQRSLAFSEELFVADNEAVAHTEFKAANSCFAAAARLYALSKDLQAEARAEMEPIVSAWKGDCLTALQETRRRDFHYYCKAINYYQRGGDVDVYNPTAGFIPPNEAGDPPLQTFTAYFREAMAAPPPPPALLDETLEAGLPSVCRGTQPPLGRNVGNPITWLDVRQAIRGPSKKFPPAPCHGSCLICSQATAEHNAWCRGEGPEPKCCAPHIKTSKSEGPDGLRAEWIKWIRFDDSNETDDLHETLYRSIALLLNHMVCRGQRCVSAGFADAIISPILKAVRAGEAADSALPASYRPVALISLLNKVLKIILAGRLACFLSVNGTIGPEQAGFVNFRSCESQVFTLLESIKARLRSQQSTYVLFLDLRAAYDKVHRGALARVLRHIGLAENIVSLLTDLMDSSRAAVRINGEMGDRFSVETGVPQGDPLSCLLFIIFIEGLVRYISSRQDVHGVDVMGVTIPPALFADDAVASAATPEELQRVLDYANEWCKAWGMIINPKTGKTEAMAFTPTSILHGTSAYLFLCPPPLSLDGTAINWTARYRYLGYDLRHDLNASRFISNKHHGAMGAYIRLLVRNPYVRASAIGTQTQLRDTELQGNLIYLASLLHVSRSALKILDSSIIRYAKSSLDSTRNPSTAALLCGTRALLATHIVARERERLYLTLRHDIHRRLPFERWPICTRLFDVLRAELPTNVSRRGAITNWVHLAERERTAAASRGAVITTPSPTCPPSTCAHVFGRSLALVEARALIGPPPEGFDRIPSAEPESNGAKKHFCALSFWLVTPPDLIGSRHGFTRSSVIGPGSCSGNWLSLTTEHRYPAVLAAQVGKSALQRWPFSPTHKPTPLDSSAANRVPYAEQFEYGPCILCGSGRETIHHLVVSCQHPAMLAQRRVIWCSALAFMEGFYRTLSHLAERSSQNATGDLFPGALRADNEEARRFIATRHVPAHSDECAFLLYWLLMVTAWPAHVAAHDDAPWQPVARTFGTLFDAIELPHTQLRGPATAWADWAEAELRALARCRSRALRRLS